MDFDAPMDVIRGLKRIRPIEFNQYVQNTFLDRPEVYSSFLHIMDEHIQHRINIPDVLMRVSELFDGHKDLIVDFCYYLRHSVCIEDENMETLRPVKKAKIEDGSAKPISEFAATSSASASYSSNYSHAIHSSSSSHSFPENAAEPHAQNDKARLRDGTGNATYKEHKLVDRPEAYYRFILLVKHIYIGRHSLLDITTYAVNVFQGYPELIEGFNRYLPAGIVLHTD